MKPTILMAPKMPAALIARLEQDYHVLGPMERPVPEALPPGAKTARVLLTVGGWRTDAALIDALPGLGLIACYGTGIEGVDQAHVRARGILLSNAADANADAVAEFAIGLMLASVRQIGKGDRFIRAGRWKGNAIERMPIVPGLRGRRLGIYGLGAIGGRIATIAAALGMEIAYHNRSRRADLLYRYEDSLIGLAEWSDVLMVAVRASAENRHAVNAAVLQALGRQGHLVNISRGIAVDEAALCDALEQGVIAGAGLDVFEAEPNVPDRLRALDNAVLTPHIAAMADSAQAAQQALLLRNLEAFFSGRPLPSGVPL
ncbi:MAG TPA: NAD(P)-dependent oxidoreductase [Bosea sp. (in: a-proteobacteria)]|uniref:NAD(P)-dependent oxidoreductase n=1 Tax=Bosea sp. (in: a-proteobacteria) TaxID=1871050 RepID=UPI002DDCA650|nr:NAD(P)-dependent oxidoreductase [Bosea sp. (in: a-proteobacteria)]HEV2555422.1 NAD(P)-dependent oxidoreductase [Bosea sp. (in: a-proteobacteria)]